MKTLLLILLALTISNTNLKAEKLEGQAKIDSLIAELEIAKEDTNKVNLYKSLSSEFSNIDPNKGLEYGNLGLDLAKKIKWRQGIAESYKYIGINYSTISKFDLSIENFQKSLKIHEELKNPQGRANLYNNLGVINMMLSKYSKSLYYYEKSLKIEEELGNKKGIATSLDNIASIYFYKSDYINTLKFSLKALQMRREIGNKFDIAASLFNLGLIYNSLSDYTKALKSFQESLKLSEEIDDIVGVSKCLGSIGQVHFFQENYTKALKYLEKSLTKKEELGDSHGIAVAYSVIGQTYLKQSEYQKALGYFKKALKIRQDIKDNRGIALSLNNIGKIYHKLLDYSNALEYLQNSYKINNELGEKINIANSQGNIGLVYLSLSQDSVNLKKSEINEFISLNKDINLNKAILNLESAISIYDEIGELDAKSQFSLGLANAYKLKGNYKKALESYEDFKKLQDSVFNIDKEKEIANLTAVREKEVAEKELVISQLENNQRKKESYLLYGGLGLLAFVVLIIFRQRRQSEKLLLNILPAKIAKRLKKRKADIADDIENASTVFIDLVGFTAYSKDKKASDVVKMLNQIFSRIDKLVLKHGLEKIKTIGDGYMAAAGVPEYQEDHTKRAADFALDVHKELEKFNSENGTDISARIGIESGPMVAGVIGDMKFIYDLWGDTVNTASRMESTGTPNKVHITENFKLELENHRNGFVFSEPVEIDIKGKGKMKTYYIENKEVVNV